MPFSQLLPKLLEHVNLWKILVDGRWGLMLALSMPLLACHTVRESNNSYIPFLKLAVKPEIEDKEAETKMVEQVVLHRRI